MCIYKLYDFEHLHQSMLQTVVPWAKPLSYIFFTVRARVSCWWNLKNLSKGHSWESEVVGILRKSWMTISMWFGSCRINFSRLGSHASFASVSLMSRWKGISICFGEFEGRLAKCQSSKRLSHHSLFDQNAKSFFFCSGFQIPRIAKPSLNCNWTPANFTICLNTFERELSILASL